MIMDMHDKISYEAWIKKRKLTTIAFAIQNVFIGCEDSIIIVNLWIYLEMLVKPDHPKIYYSAILVCRTLSSIIFSLFICKLADQYRDIRKLFFLTNTALIVGNIIYMIPLSPWLLLLGRVVASIGIVQGSISSGELARSYPCEELISKLSLMSLAYSFGFMVAPGINVAFTSVDFWIGKWHIAYANISGIFMSVLFILAQLISFLMIYDLSKEYDLKKGVETVRKPINNNNCLIVKYPEGTPLTSEEHGNEKGWNATEATSLISDQHKVRASLLLRKLVTHFGTSLLLLLGCFETFLINSFDMCLPLIVIDILKWPIAALNGITLGSALMYVLPCILLSLKQFSDQVIFYTSVVGIFGYTLLQLIQLLWKVYEGSMVFNIILSILYCILFSNVMIIKDVFLCGFLAKMVSSRYQSLTDGIRLAFGRIGSIVALCSAPHALESIEIVGVIYICMILTFGCLLIVRQRYLRNPEIIIYR